MFNLIGFEKIRTPCGKYSGYLLLGLPEFCSLVCLRMGMSLRRRLTAQTIM